jgi:AmpD protein
MTESLKINSLTGLLEPVEFQCSPHQDVRPEQIAIDMVVVHGISLPPGQFGTGAVPAFFCGHLDSNSHPAFADIASLRVSAHLLIQRDGHIIQFVPFHHRAWHAGVSSFEGRTGCNDFSVGIELEGTDDVAYEDCQYQQLGQVIKLLQQTYPMITPDRIVGHSDIAPGRKTDPGPFFNWDQLRGILV